MTFDQPKRLRSWPSLACVPYGSVSIVMVASARLTAVSAPGASSPASIRTSARAYGSIWPKKLSSTSRGKKRFSRPAKVPVPDFWTLCCVMLPMKSPVTPMSKSSWPLPRC